ncbi:hypothetical protein [uncultured Brevundimonas sp.]|uniref:hypothetical protein n=1 Tax=uncultured Brevundimonas sp. TaxID=213418 RepID=UPI0030EB6FF1|tara:strand:+ start:6671 stop:6994 length:324 start_codon:yes stop_codon:yes gene_type:complete
MHRLEAEAFADDVEVSLQCGALEAQVPERLFRRLVLLGRAYELHRLSLLQEDAVLDSVQAQSLSDELEFVRELVPTDHALATLLAQATPVVLAASRDAKSSLVIEWQ